MLRVLCPNCARRFRTRTEAMGKTAVCSGCKQPFKIGTKLAPFEWQDSDIVEDSWIGVAPPEEKKELKHCINCEAPLDEGQMTCPACGMNQVTGLVRRSKLRPRTDQKSIWTVIPVRLMVTIAIVLGIGLGVYLLIRSISKSVVEMGDQLADESVVMKAARYLREDGDEYTLPQHYAGCVTDENLPRFAGMLSSDNAGFRRAARLLIECGTFTQLKPIIALGESHETVEEMILTLDAIGARRLVELSCDADKQVRKSAAHGLCLLNNLQKDDKTIKRLAEAVSLSIKTQTLNRLCRPYPQATGAFGVFVEEIKAPFMVNIDQYGRTFYLRIGGREFRSLLEEIRTFDIPIEHWCDATGAAVDSSEVRGLLDGSVTLISPVGAGWKGTIRITVKREPTGPLPGFLPFEVPPVDEPIEVPIFLE